MDFYISQESLKDWYYRGKRQVGGKIHYPDSVIELCLLIKEYYKLGLRQTQGFVQSLIDGMGAFLKVPDYTTLSRRAETLKVQFKPLRQSYEDRVIAMDSTGLSVYNRREWNAFKHKKNSGKYQDKWRKLHVIIDTHSGEIIGADYSLANVNDCLMAETLLNHVAGDVQAVCGDMAYDTTLCRKAIKQKKAKQLIPPIRKARLSKDNRNMKEEEREILKERDDAISYIQHNKINGDMSLARASWKEKVGYHRRSRSETTMWQIKSHSSDRLTNYKEKTRNTQALIKCKLVNHILFA